MNYQKSRLTSEQSENLPRKDQPTAQSAMHHHRDYPSFQDIVIQGDSSQANLTYQDEPSLKQLNQDALDFQPFSKNNATKDSNEDQVLQTEPPQLRTIIESQESKSHDFLQKLVSDNGPNDTQMASIDYDFQLVPTVLDDRPKTTNLGRQEKWAFATSDNIYTEEHSEYKQPLVADVYPELANIPFIMRPSRHRAGGPRKTKLNAEKMTIDCNLFPASAKNNQSLSTVAYGLDSRLRSRQAQRQRDFIDLQRPKMKSENRSRPSMIKEMNQKASIDFSMDETQTKALSTLSTYYSQPIKSRRPETAQNTHTKNDVRPQTQEGMRTQTSPSNFYLSSNASFYGNTQACLLTQGKVLSYNAQGLNLRDSFNQHVNEANDKKLKLMDMIQKRNVLQQSKTLISHKKSNFKKKLNDSTFSDWNNQEDDELFQKILNDLPGFKSYKHQKEFDKLQNTFMNLTQNDYAYSNIKTIKSIRRTDKSLNIGHRLEPMSAQNIRHKSTDNFRRNASKYYEKSSDIGMGLSKKWMRSLRKTAERDHKTESQKIKEEKEAIKYNRYLCQVKTLNMVKEYLSQYRKRLDRNQKEKLIETIMTMTESLKEYKFD